MARAACRGGRRREGERLMLTPSQVRQQVERTMAPIAELRAVVLASLDGERRACALEQLERMRRWLTRQIQESGGSS